MVPSAFYGRVRGCFWDGLDDARLDEGVPVRSKLLKESVLALLAIALAVSVVLIVVCVRTGSEDIQLAVTLVWLAMVWFVIGLVVLGLFMSHPVYRSRIEAKLPWRNKTQEPLLEPEDLEIDI